MGKSGTKLEWEPFDEVSRGEWYARPPIATEPVELPVSVVVVHFTNTPTCKTRQECIRAVQELQRVHMDEKNFIDIKYNFLIGGDGAVYEGRGWDASGLRVPLIHEEFSKTNMESVDVAFIGSYADYENSEKMKKTYEGFLKASRLYEYIMFQYEELWTEGSD